MMIMIMMMMREECSMCYTRVVGVSITSGTGVHPYRRPVLVSYLRLCSKNLPWSSSPTQPSMHNRCPSNEFMHVLR